MDLEGQTHPVHNRYVLSGLYRLPGVPTMHWGCYSTTKKEKWKKKKMEKEENKSQGLSVKIKIYLVPTDFRAPD